MIMRGVELLLSNRGAKEAVLDRFFGSPKRSRPSSQEGVSPLPRPYARPHSSWATAAGQGFGNPKPPGAICS